MIYIVILEFAVCLILIDMIIDSYTYFPQSEFSEHDADVAINELRQIASEIKRRRIDRIKSAWQCRPTGQQIDAAMCIAVAVRRYRLERLAA